MRLSVLYVPRSDASVISGVPGAGFALVTPMIVTAAERYDSLPAISVKVADMLVYPEGLKLTV